jgi:hypothetical protein
VVVSNKRFNEAFLKAVDSAFDSLGKSCKQALYFHLKNTFHVGRREIPEKVEEFDNALKLIFKDGTIFLERLILDELCEGLEVKFEENVLNFDEAVLKIRSMVLERESLLMVSDFGEVSAVKSKRGGEKFDSGS